MLKQQRKNKMTNPCWAMLYFTATMLRTNGINAACFIRPDWDWKRASERANDIKKKNKFRGGLNAISFSIAIVVFDCLCFVWLFQLTHNRTSVDISWWLLVHRHSQCRCGIVNIAFMVRENSEPKYENSTEKRTQE